MAERYETLVVRGATSKDVPREAAGGEVVAWSAGHALAEQGPLEEFVQALADGDHAFENIDIIQAKASKVLELSNRQREHGWLDNEEKSNG